MTKEIKQIVFVGYGLAVLYGIGLWFHLDACFLSFVDPAALSKSFLFINKFKTMDELRIHAAFFVAIFLPQLIALLIVVKLKEWARKFLVIVNLFLCLYVLFRMVLSHQSIDSFLHKSSDVFKSKKTKGK